MVSLNHLLTITIKKNHDKIQWVFWIISAEEQIYTLVVTAPNQPKSRVKAANHLNTCSHAKT